MKIAAARKAIAAFLVPVVPAVASIVSAGEITRDSVWLLVIAVLSGLGVYGVRNDA